MRVFQMPLEFSHYQFSTTEQNIICRKILPKLPEGAVAQIYLVKCDVVGDRGTNMLMGTKYGEVYQPNLGLYIESPPSSSPVDLNVLATSIRNGKFDSLSLANIVS